jgi:HK97 family phage major capsid protein
MTSVTFPALQEAEAKLSAKRKELGAIFAEAKDPNGGTAIDLKRVKSIKGTTHDIAAHIRQLNDELTDLGKEVDGHRKTLKAAQTALTSDDKYATESTYDLDPGGEGNGRPRTKSVGELFTESDAYKLLKGPIGPEANLDVNLKTLLTTTTGWDPEETRTGRLVEFATRPLQVAQIMPQTTTTQSAVQYMEETTYTNAAAETAEGGTFPEAALAFTEQTSIVRKIPVFIPVTDEQLEDEPRIRGVINNRLPFMIRQRLDSQVLVGNGTAPNLRGILNVVGIQTVAKGTDPTPDAIYKAIVLVETTGQAVADTAVINPLDWQDIRLLRTADGIYIWGNPSDAGPERIWGLRVVRAQALTQNTGVVGDFGNFSELAVRRGIDVQVSNSHGTFFVEGKQAIRADMRVAAVWYRPAAFCSVTGI